MNCVNHPDRPGVGTCVLCGEPLCESCGVELDSGTYCRLCLQERLTGTAAEGSETALPSVEARGGTAEAAVAEPRRVSPKSPFLAFVLSLVPGVGHMYLELMGRGLSFLVLFFGALALSVLLEAGEIMAFFGPVIYFYSVFDALQFRRRINAGEAVADRPVVSWRQVEVWLNLKPGQTQNLFAYLLIIFGALKLAQNLLPWGFLFRHNPIASMSPILLVVAGLWLLTSSRERRNSGHTAP